MQARARSRASYEEPVLVRLTQAPDIDLIWGGFEACEIGGCYYYVKWIEAEIVWIN